jgi:magnesium chelatase subunit I
LSITAFENLLSTAERRALKSGDENDSAFIRFYGYYSCDYRKVELVYEGEQEGCRCPKLCWEPQLKLFSRYFPKIEKTEKPDEKTAYTDLMNGSLPKAVLNY